MNTIPAGGSRRRLALFLFSMAALQLSAGAATLSDCVRETDDGQRLACYDGLFRPGRDEAAGGGAEKASGPAQEPGMFESFWGLPPGTRQDLFVVHSYQPNFLLPLHYSSDINQEPESPTHRPGASRIRFQPQEAKFQISLRAKVGADMVFRNDGLWFAYTQRSLWQVWNGEESSPFRNTDYQPEAIYVVPVGRETGALPAGWRWSMVQLGIAHQSNGQGDPLSRSWNRAYAGIGLEKGGFGIQARVLRRLRAHGSDDNPDVVDFLGNTEIAATWLSGRARSSLAWRSHPGRLARGSLQGDWSYPVIPDRPQGLRWYVQLFSGYGETLIDYNHRQNSIGLGLALSHF